VHYHDTKFEPAVRALVPLAKKAPGLERDQQIDYARDQLFDRLFRLNKMVAADPWLGGAELSLADYSFSPTLSMGLDLLTHLERELALSDQIAAWLEFSILQHLIEREVSRVRGAVAQWLGTEGNLN
jgi:glutathione S-transferase